MLSPAPISPAARRVLLAVTFVLLFVNFRWNVFHIEQAQQDFNLTADYYIIAPMEEYAAGPARLRLFGNLTLQEGDGKEHPYVMMLGLQRIVFSQLSPHTAESVERALPWFRGLAAGALALVFTAFVAFICANFGWLAAAITALLLVLSDWLIIVGPSLVWVAALFFAPFVLACLFGDPDRPLRQRRRLAAGFTLLCLAKFLCGYDYITNICAAVAVPFLYYGLLRRHRLAAIARRILLYGALSIAAFFTAIALQILQFWLVQPDFRGTVAYFFREAHMRTSTMGEGISNHYDQAVMHALERLHLPATLIGGLEPALTHIRPLLRYFHYLGMTAFSIPLPGRALPIPIGIFVAGFAATMWALRKRLSPVRNRAAAWMWATLAALVVTHFWAIAANGHMTHTFFNAIIFYIPFLPMAYAALGIAVARAVGHQQAGHSETDSQNSGDVRTDFCAEGVSAGV